MELVTVGTGTVAPSATRTSACHWVSRARQDPARLRPRRAAPPGPVRATVARGHPRRLVPLPPGPLGRAADARVRAEVHDGAAAAGAARHPRPARRGPAREDAGGGVRRVAARPRLPDRPPGPPGPRGLPARRRREPRDLPPAP